MNFSATRTGRTAFAILLGSCLVELPLDAAIVPLLVHDDAAARLIHALMVVSVLSTLVWALGDRWLVGAGRHVLTEQGLLLRIGARTEGLVPLDAIAACSHVNESVPTWCARHGIAPRRTLRATPLPLDKPNSVLILKPDNGVRLTHMGVERGGLACIFLYLDQPADLCKALVTASQRP